MAEEAMIKPARCDSSQNVKVAIRVRPLQKMEALAAKKTCQSRHPVVPTGVSRVVAKRCEQLRSVEAWALATLGDDNKCSGDSGDTSSRNDGALERVSTAARIISEKGAIRKYEGRNVFPFDWIFDEEQSTKQVYRDVVYPIIEATFSGTHGTVFVYGQTGTGKTYTMQGGSVNRSLVGNKCKKERNEGVIQMGIRDLFEKIALNPHKRDYTVRASYFEIYNERVRDLLGNSNAKADIKQTKLPNNRVYNSSQKSSNRKTELPILTLRDYIHGDDVHIDAFEKQITGLEDALYLLQHGNQNRTSAPTTLNQMSSRSHAIFRLTIESRNRMQQEEENKKKISCEVDINKAQVYNGTVRVSVLNFVDLAGSESSRASSTVGKRKQEGGKINQRYSERLPAMSDFRTPSSITLLSHAFNHFYPQYVFCLFIYYANSLLSLSQVIHALSLSEKKRPKFINYRNSKLTRLLRPHLSGNAVMVVLCCVTLARAHLEETRSTLKFAYNAKRIEMHPVVNDVTDDKSLFGKLQKELTNTRQELNDLMERQRKSQQHRHQQQRHQYEHQNQQQKRQQHQHQRRIQQNQQKQQRHYQKQKQQEQPEQEEEQEQYATPPSSEMTASSTTDATSSESRGRAYKQRFSTSNEMNSGKKVFVRSKEKCEAKRHQLNVLQPLGITCHNAVRIHSRDQAAIESASHKAVGPKMNHFIVAKSPDCFSTIGESTPPSSLSVKHHESPPLEVTFLQPLRSRKELINIDINDLLDEMEKRTEFLTKKLNAADSMIENLSRDLTNARICIHDLVFQNVQLEKQLKRKNSDETT